MNLLSLIPFMKTKDKASWFAQLIDKDNRKVSCMNVFTIIVTLVGVVLLLMPIIAIIVELIFNHTVTMSWSDIAAFIGAVAAMFTSVGFAKAWNNYNESKFGKPEHDDNNSEDEQDTFIINE